MNIKSIGNKLIIGRSEWCALHSIGIPAIKAKVDTGAQTSALHATNIKRYSRKSIDYVSFVVPPLQGNIDTMVICKARILDERSIMSSNGHKEHRYVISTQIELANTTWDIELTLSDRDPLRYRMLLGREAMGNHLLVDPSIECNQGHLITKDVKKLYQ